MIPCYKRHNLEEGENGSLEYMGDWNNFIFPSVETRNNKIYYVSHKVWLHLKLYHYEWQWAPEWSVFIVI